MAAVTERTAKPLLTRPARIQFDSSLLKLKPKRAGYPLEKLRAEPQSYVGQIVVPSGMYHLARSPNDRPGGPRKLLVNRLQIEERTNKPLNMSSSAGTEVDVEPRVAERVDQIGLGNWTEKVAILSIWFGKDAPLLVKIEILDSHKTGFKRATFNPEGDVDYFTWVVTPEKAELGKGDDADWETPGRMLHFANLYKKRVRAFNRLNQDRQMLQLQSVMSDMWGSMMQGAAADAARQQALQRAVGGR